MPIKIMLAIPSLNRLDRLRDMLASVVASTRQPDKVMILNNGWQFSDSDRVEWSRSFPVDVYTPNTNLGVAGSVNFAWRNTPDGWFWCHCNDDVELDPKCLELMVNVAEANPDAFIVPDHGEGSAFTLFMLHATMRDIIGYFDPQFFPSYMEDNDLGRRMNLLHTPRVLVPGAAYVHHTSSTLAAYDEAKTRWHHDQFRANVQRYIAKWGGEMDKGERFDIPYNGSRGHTLANAHMWHKERIE